MDTPTYEQLRSQVAELQRERDTLAEELRGPVLEEPFRRLGEYLGNALNDEQFKHAESLLNSCLTAYKELQAKLDEQGKQSSIGYQYLFNSPFGGQVWRDSANEWNGSNPVKSREIYAHPIDTSAMIEQAKAEYREDALRYRVLRNQDVDDNFPRSGLFIGCIPDNEVLTEEDADAAIDAIRSMKP